MMFTIGVFAIIFDSHGRVLLGHRRDMDLWDLPGGGMEIGELPPHTAIRETQEEAGLDVVVERFIGMYGKPGGTGLVLIFHCRVIGGCLSVSDEADHWRYFELEEIPLNTNPRQEDRIRDALQFRTQPIFRHQQGPSCHQWLTMLGTSLTK